MGHNLARLRGAGYSQEVLDSLGHARAVSTNQVYDSKWKLFAGFCEKRGIPPEDAGPPLVADFLLFLFRDRHCSARTVASYRSALGNVLRFTSSYDPANDKIISQLIKGFKRQRPPTVSKVPHWDLGIVLRHFARPENANGFLDLHSLTAKAVFLLSLATAGRCQALAALEDDLSVVREFPLVIQIPFVAGFLPKQFFLLKNPKPPAPVELSELPGLNSVGICPVRTLLAYRSRVAPRRLPSQSSLFIPHAVGKTGRLHPSAVGRYIVKSILQAYDAEGLKHPSSVKAHDVRGVATSLRALTGVSLVDVVSAGGWSQPNTFVNFYLKQFTKGQLSSLAHLPDFCAAGGTIKPCSLLQERGKPQEKAARKRSKQG